MAQGGTKYSCLISIHALLAESDGESVVKIVEQWAFLSTLSLRRATFHRYCYAASTRFLSTLSLRRATSKHRTVLCAHCDFYPRSPCGERLSSADALPANFLFLSTLSLRRATFSSSFRAGICRFLSTLSLRRATRSLKRPFGTMHRFLSTLSLRRATICGACCSAIIRNFYPRSPCGERLEMARAQFAISEISIHALLAESDLVVIIFWCSTMQFLSTLSLRRATTAIHVIQGGVDISIHALLAESDFFPQGFLFLCGISIHALLAESDPRFRCI